jgi:hypothetical protein
LRFGGSDDIVADYAISSILTVTIVTFGKSGVKPREFEGRALNKPKAQF